MNNYVFLSLVGEQPMGVLYPLQTCLNNPGILAVDKILLVPTKRTEEYANVLKAHCEKEGLPPVDILPAWNVPTTPAGEILELARMDGSILFNVAGGMNFASAKMVLELMDIDGSALLSTSRNNVLFRELVGQENIRLTPPKTMSIRDVLALQQARVEPSPNTSKFFDLVQRFNRIPDLQQHVKLSKNSLRNVVVDGMYFDLVWNDETNTVNLLRFIPYVAEADFDQKKLLELCREICRWASTRDKSLLYHRIVHVLCPDPISKGHIEKESGGKVVSLQYSPYTVKKFGLSIWEHFADQEDEKLYAKGRRTVVSDSLVVALGTDAAPTFSAIASHGLPNLFLCHTTDEGMRARAEKLRDMIAQEKVFPHVKNVCLVPSDHAGGVLMRNLDVAEDARNVQVNITPGTKGQAAFLALWGKRHGFSVWSIHDGMALLDGPEGESELIPAQSCDPVQLIELTSDEPVECDPPLDEEQTAFCDLLLNHMRGCAEKGQIWGLSTKARLDEGKSQTASGITLSNLGSRDWSISSPNAGNFHFNILKGSWFEKLAARALARAGAEHVHTSVSVLWPYERQTKLEMKYQEKQHRIEMDVLCTWKTRPVLVSCKAGKGGTLSKAVLEAQAMAASLARFTIPIVCSLKVEEFRVEREGNFIGWRELCDPERLADVLDKACRFKRSTREPSGEPSGAPAPGSQGTDNPKPEKPENPA